MAATRPAAMADPTLWHAPALAQKRRIPVHKVHMRGLRPEAHHSGDRATQRFMLQRLVCQRHGPVGRTQVSRTLPLTVRVVQLKATALSIRRSQAELTMTCLHLLRRWSAVHIGRQRRVTRASLFQLTRATTEPMPGRLPQRVCLRQLWIPALISMTTHQMATAALRPQAWREHERNPSRGPPP